MVKLTGGRIDSFVRRPDPGVRAALVYGPDAGLVRERATLLARTVLDDLSDPFRVSELTGDSIAASPAVLADEMAAIALTGGRRLVRVRDAGDSALAGFTNALKSPPPGDTLVVVEAGDLDKRSKLRALFEGSDIAAALPCYVEEDAGLERVVGDILGQAGLSITPEARAWLAETLAGDRAVVRGELDKLVTYMGGQKRVELADAQACIGDSDAAELDEPAWAAADGDAVALDRALERLFGQGASPVGVLRAAQRHFDRLHRVSARAAAGEPVGTVLSGLRPPLFFKVQDRFAAQIRRWPPATLADALTRLVDAEADCKRTGMPDEALCGRLLHQLARSARRAR